MLLRICKNSSAAAMLPFYLGGMLWSSHLISYTLANKTGKPVDNVHSTLQRQQVLRYSTKVRRLVQVFFHLLRLTGEGVENSAKLLQLLSTRPLSRLISVFSNILLYSLNIENFLQRI